jgi:hypothetical protein
VDTAFDELTAASRLLFLRDEPAKGERGDRRSQPSGDQSANGFELGRAACGHATKLAARDDRGAIAHLCGTN